MTTGSGESGARRKYSNMTPRKNMWSSFTCGGVVTKLIQGFLRPTQRASGTIFKEWEAQPPFHQNLGFTWGHAAADPDQGMGLPLTNQELLGAVTAKSLDLVVGEEGSQRTAWSWSSRTADI